jgi:hypothetical protein
LTKKKNERKREFINVQLQIDQICGEIAGTVEVGEQVATPQVNDDDLTLERQEFLSQLEELEKEKVLSFLIYSIHVCHGASFFTIASLFIDGMPCYLVCRGTGWRRFLSM